MTDGTAKVNSARDSVSTQIDLRQIWKDGGIAVGAWCAIPSGLTVEAIARCGYDWICIDMQHGCIDYAVALEMMRAADVYGTPSIVRVPWNEPGIIGRVLDAGAAGVIIPMIQSAADARAAVDACLYPPFGKRSFGPMRVSLRDGPSYFRTANDKLIVIPMIETSEALAEVDEIAAIPGVGALFLGPFDMSVNLGLRPGDNDGEPLFDAAIAKIVAAAKRNKIGAAVLSNSGLYPLRVEQGFNMVSVVTDLTALSNSLRGELSKTRQ